MEESMTPEIRRAALRAAAKVALVTAVGCGSSTAPPSNVSTAPPQTCTQYLDTLKQVQSREELPADDPLRTKLAVYGAFADRTARESARTHECCTEEMKGNAQGKHQWACCSALDNQVPEGAVAYGCTPWGPPCPPVMPGARATA